MSVTFWCPEAPTKIIPCRLCDISDDPSPCWELCDGTEEVSSIQEVNWANANARDILSLLGEYELDGMFDSSKIPEILRRIFFLLNSEESRRVLVRSPREEFDVKVKKGDVPEITPHLRFLDFGNTDHQTIRRLASLQSLLISAHESGYSVVWG